MMPATSALQRHPFAARLLDPRMLAVYAAIAMIVVYLVLRAPGTIDRPRAAEWDPLRPTLLTWTALAALLALASPRAGLIVLVAIGPFEDPAIIRQVFVGDFNISDDIRAKSVIAIALLAGVVVRVVWSVVVGRSWGRPAADARRSRGRRVGRVGRAMAVPIGPPVTSPWVSRATGAAARRTPASEAPTAVVATPAKRTDQVLSRLGDPGIVLALAAVLVLGTGLSLVTVSVRIEEVFARQAIGVWLGGIVTPFAALFAAAWLARRGDLSTVLVVVVAASVAGVLGLVDHFAKGAFTGTALAWTIEAGIPGESRLEGVAGLPNAAGTMLLAPVAILGSAAAIEVVRWLARIPRVGRLITYLADRAEAAADDPPWDRRVRLVAAAVAIVATGILTLTLSRSALAAILVIAVILAWRVGRRAGMALLLVGLVVLLLLVPRFLAQRGDATPQGGPPQEPGLLTKGDDDRVRAWRAAVLMWQDAPLSGHGFHTYKLLHRQYGERRVTAPHNEWLRLFAEDGLFVGLAGVGFVVFGFVTLARGRGWLATGILGVFVGYVLMASFNNPLTYGQVGLMVLPVVGVGLGLIWSARAGPVPVAVRADVPEASEEPSRVSTPAPPDPAHAGLDAGPA